MKTCFKCHRPKPLDDFYKHGAMTDGHLGKCKECTKADVAARAVRIPEIIKAFDHARAMLPHRVAARKAYDKTEDGKTSRRESLRRYRRNNVLKSDAHLAVSHAIESGKLTKRPCEECGVKKVEAHHDDYTKPLNIRWLCNKHHQAHHAKLKAKSVK